MYTVKEATTLEKILPPKKLLFLCDARLDDRAPDIADSIGHLLASYPFESPRYGSEVAQVWGRYAREAEPDADHDIQTGSVRSTFARIIKEQMESVVAPPAPLHHCKAIVALLTRVAGITAFSRTGDQLVYKVILSELPRVQAAELSVYEVPYKAAGQFYGDSANRRVRALFERNVEEEIKTACWETEKRVEYFVLFFILLLETGADLATTICCNHELAFYVNRSRVAPFCWDGQLGVVYANTLVYADPDALFPIPTLAMHFLELAELSGFDGSDAAASILCAVKTPEKVCPHRPHHPPACTVGSL